MDELTGSLHGEDSMHEFAKEHLQSLTPVALAVLAASPPPPARQGFVFHARQPSTPPASTPTAPVDKDVCVLYLAPFNAIANNTYKRFIVAGINAIRVYTYIGEMANMLSLP